ncbi:hypothetical protein L2E82_06422 [Cichorium intybus]|uniref:Uncharacterized protein n=1 Tax=Cichorium intybus TaxID=13427 RepID=A0ACB9H9X8_CICIN|nr:hypothetical protein L2E82_06422 [Cichorium intybus]
MNLKALDNGFSLHQNKKSNTRVRPGSTTTVKRSCKVRCESSSKGFRFRESGDELDGKSWRSLEGVVRCSANYVPLSPISFLERAAEVYSDRTSVVYGCIKYTWEETHRRCVKLASALNHLGISRGDVVAVLAPNVPAVLELHFAVPMAGAIICALNKRLDPKNKTDGAGKYLLMRDAIGDGVGDATENGVGDIVGEAVESEKRDLELQEDDPVAPFANLLYGSK